jgi:nucleoside diphosphate kinase
MSIRQKNEYWYRLMYAHVPSEVFKNMEAYLLGDHLIGIQVWGENAVAACKNIKHLIRSQFADTNITYRNVIHTSDSPDTAYWEANYFFAGGLDAQQN